MAEAQRVTVIDDCARRVDRSPASHARSPGEIGVLEICKERFIETTNVVEHRATIETGARGGAKDIYHVRSRRPSGRSKETFMRHAQRVHLDPGRVDRVVAIDEEDLRRYRPDIGTSRCGRKHLGDRSRLGDAVIVNERYPGAVCL